VLSFAENTRAMTFADGLEFIERTRRQLDRFGELPHAEGQVLHADDVAAIRQQCDELEADIRRSLSNV
jgi:hypothetical protein